MELKKLDERLLDLRKELIKINAQVAVGTLPENPGRIKEIKKTIAKILTQKKLRGGKGSING